MELNIILKNKNIPWRRNEDGGNAMINNNYRPNIYIFYCSPTICKIIFQISQIYRAK